MRQLLLLRHAKSSWDDPAQNDHARPLNASGRAAAAAIRTAMRQLGLVPDVVLVSSARRTRETWEELAPAFPKANVEFSRGLYLASRDHLAHAVDATGDEAGCLMIVGHNPGLHELAIACAGDAALDDSGMLDSFPTSAAAVFSGKDNGGWSLERVMIPRDHGGGVL